MPVPETICQLSAGFRRRYPFLLLLLVPTLTEMAEAGRLPTSPRELLTDAVATAVVAILVWRLIRAQRMLRAASEQDPLTGLLNRRRFDEDLVREVARAKRQETQLVLAYIDVDRFKHVNDRHGHETGDRVLTTIARSLESNLREHVDLCYRIGGDEFAVLSLANNEDGARAIHERLNGLSDELGRGLVSYQSGLSIGVAWLHGDEDASAIRSRADGLMYQSKYAGKASRSEQGSTERSHGNG